MKTILIADDEPSLRRLVRVALSVGDYELVEAADGDAAWETVLHRHPDLVLADVQMPGRTGLDLTRAIKSDPALSGTRVILLTSRAQAADIAAGVAAGADTYLTKPFSPAALIDLVAQHVGERAA